MQKIIARRKLQKCKSKYLRIQSGYFEIGIKSINEIDDLFFGEKLIGKHCSKESQIGVWISLGDYGGWNKCLKEGK